MQILTTLAVSFRMAALQIDIVCWFEKRIIQTEHYKSTFDSFPIPTQDLNTEPSTTWTTLPSNTDLEDLWNEAEDSPGRSKRVVIRHSSV
jgi:hypothetical protein